MYIFIQPFQYSQDVKQDKPLSGSYLEFKIFFLLDCLSNQGSRTQFALFSHNW